MDKNQLAGMKLNELKELAKSKGMRDAYKYKKAELNDLCNYNQINIKINENFKINLKKSGGPSCSTLVTIEEKHIDIISTLVNKPVNILGRFY